MIINYKMILLPIMLVYTLYRLSLFGLNHSTILKIFLFLIIFFILLCGLINGLYQNNTKLVLEEFRLLFSVVLIFIIYVLSYDNNMEFRNDFIKFSIVGVFFYNVVKIIIEGLFIFQVVDVDFIESFSLWFGGRMPIISPLPFDMIRLYWTELDFVSICIAFLYFIFSKNNNKPINILFYLVIFLGVIIGFSRLLFFEFIFFLCLGLIYKKGVVRALISIVVVMGLFGSLFFNPLSELIEKRFSEAYISTSDQVRIDQSLSLLDKWAEAPLLGHGFGASADIIRNVDKPYQYEIWWLALWMKLGVLGVLLFLMIILMPLLLGKVVTKNILMILISYYIFVFSSFTNQYLSTSVSGVLLVFMYFIYLNESRQRVYYE